MDSMFCQFDQSLARCDNVGGHLARQGYAIIDNLFDEELLAALRDEVDFLDNSQWLQPSGNKLQHGEGEQGSTIVVKPGVFERSIVLKSELAAGESTLQQVPHLSECYYQRERLVQCLSRHTKLNITALDQVKLARIMPGGAFMVHTDTTPTKDRALTMTLYLNSPRGEYDPEVDGGQLRLYPLSAQCVPSVVDVHPVYGRAVLFSSNSLPHRVLPSGTDCRYCLSFFFYGETVPPPVATPADLAHIPAAARSEAGKSIIYDMFQKLRRSGDDSARSNGEDLTALVARIKQSYPEVLCALIHTEEYSTSLAEAFSELRDTEEAEEENGEDGDRGRVIRGGGRELLPPAVARRRPEAVVRGALQFFEQRCGLSLASLDPELLAFVQAARRYVGSEAFTVTMIQ